MQYSAYKRDSKGNILEWNIKVEKKGMIGLITIEEGKINGKKRVKTIEIKKGKNINKSNETTPYEQAIAETASKFERKKKTGYKTIFDLGMKHLPKQFDEEFYNELDKLLPKDNTDNNDNIIPMKCQQYFKDKNRTIPRPKFPVIGQAKVNGVRAVAKLELDSMSMFSSVQLLSKTGLSYTIPTLIIRDLEYLYEECRNNPVITDLLSEYKLRGEDLIFDGELYYDADYLGQIVSAVRGQKGQPDDNSHKLQYYIFDLAIPKLVQKDRLALLNKIFKYVYRDGNLNPATRDFYYKSKYTRVNLVQVRNKIINNHLEAERFTKEMISLGFEGAIFREQGKPYGFGKRPMYITKYKIIKSREYNIVDVVSSGRDKYEDENGKHDIAMFVCENNNGDTFEVVPEASKEERYNILINRDNYIGKQLTVEFYEYTEEGKPFHAKGIVRDYE